jgi:hypothetical protein
MLSVCTLCPFYEGFRGPISARELCKIPQMLRTASRAARTPGGAPGRVHIMQAPTPAPPPGVERSRSAIRDPRSLSLWHFCGEMDLRFTGDTEIMPILQGFSRGLQLFANLQREVTACFVAAIAPAGLELRWQVLAPMYGYTYTRNFIQYLRSATRRGGGSLRAREWRTRANCHDSVTRRA